MVNFDSRTLDLKDVYDKIMSGEDVIVRISRLLCKY